MSIGTPEIYLLKKDDAEDDGRRYEITYGTAPYSIGRLICSECGEHASAVFEYSGFDVSRLGEDVTRYLLSYRPTVPFRDSFSGPRELNIEQMRDLSARLAPILGPDRPFGPFTTLGPQYGTAEGKFDDFNWALGRGRPFLRRSAFDAIRAAGFPISGVDSKLEYRRARLDPLVEIEALPTARVHPSQRPSSCGTCGYVTQQPKGIRLDAGSFDRSIPLQCIYERPDLIVVNAALADFISDRQFTGFNLVPMNVE